MLNSPSTSCLLESPPPRVSASLPPAPSANRLPELDMLRGFLLLWMTLTHLPTRVSIVSNQMVGYVSSAEGFIFLAAFLTGQVQFRTKSKYGPSIALRKLFQRVGRIYRYHLALLAFAFTFGPAAAAIWHPLAIRNLLDFYLLRPVEAFAAAVMLAYNPPLFDILPIYIVFMLLTPLLLRAAGRVGWGAVLAGQRCRLAVGSVQSARRRLRRGVPIRISNPPERKRRLRSLRVAAPLDDRSRPGNHAACIQLLPAPHPSPRPAREYGDCSRPVRVPPRPSGCAPHSCPFPHLPGQMETRYLAPRRFCCPRHNPGLVRPATCQSQTGPRFRSPGPGIPRSLLRTRRVLCDRAQPRHCTGSTV